MNKFHKVPKPFSSLLSFRYRLIVSDIVSVYFPTIGVYPNTGVFMKSRIAKIILTGFLLSVLISSAAAHGTYMSSSLSGVEVKAWYTGGDPMADSLYEVYKITDDGNGGENAELYLTGRTDDAGMLTFRPEKGVDIYRVKVIEGEHVASKLIDLSASGVESGDAYEPSVLTIVGGLGWIVGLCGIALFILSKKQKTGSGM